MVNLISWHPKFNSNFLNGNQFQSLQSCTLFQLSKLMPLFYSKELFILLRRVYYSLAVWRFKPILSAGLRFHSHSFGGLRLRNYRAVAGNHKFSSRFSVFACFCGGYLNRVKRLRRLSGNFILLKTSLFNKGLRFRVRLVRATLCFPSHVGGVGR